MRLDHLLSKDSDELRFTILGRSFGYVLHCLVLRAHRRDESLCGSPYCSLKTAQKKQENLKGLFNAPLSARVARHFPRKRGKLRERDCRHLQPPLLAGEGDHAKRGGRGEIMSVGSGTVLTKRFSQAN